MFADCRILLDSFGRGSIGIINQMELTFGSLEIFIRHLLITTVPNFTMLSFNLMSDPKGREAVLQFPWLRIETFNQINTSRIGPKAE